MKLTNNIKIVTITGVCLVVLINSGCGFRYSTDIMNKQLQRDLTATKAAEVVITDKDITTKQYTSICDITVKVRKMTLFSSDPTPQDVQDKLKEEAAKVGADAVIFVRTGSAGMSAMSYGELEGKGRAIKYNQ